MRFRPAQMSDLPTLLKLEQTIIDSERPIDSAIKKQPTNYYDLSALIESSKAEVLVLEDQQRIVATGYAKICRSEPWLEHQEHAYLGFMYVEHGYRGQGLNQKMMERLKDWCRKQSIDHLYLEVYTDKKSAIRAYEKAGFQSSLLQMKLSLD